MLYEELRQIISRVMNQGLRGQALMNMLMEKVNPTEVYASDDLLITDSYFSLLHAATGEETVTSAEWRYLLDCLKGSRDYSLDEKLQ